MKIHSLLYQTKGLLLVALVASAWDAAEAKRKYPRPSPLPFDTEGCQPDCVGRDRFECVQDRCLFGSYYYHDEICIHVQYCEYEREFQHTIDCDAENPFIAEHEETAPPADPYTVSPMTMTKEFEHLCQYGSRDCNDWTGTYISISGVVLVEQPYFPDYDCSGADCQCKEGKEEECFIEPDCTCNDGSPENFSVCFEEDPEKGKEIDYDYNSTQDEDPQGIPIDFDYNNTQDDHGGVGTDGVFRRLGLKGRQ